MELFIVEKTTKAFVLAHNAVDIPEDEILQEIEDMLPSDYTRITVKKAPVGRERQLILPPGYKWDFPVADASDDTRYIPLRQACTEATNVATPRN